MSGDVTKGAAGSALLAPLQAWWRTLAGRERRLVAGLGLLLLLGGLWLVALQPALQTLRRAPAQLDAMDAQLQGMQRLATEAQMLRGAPTVTAEQAAAALKAATDRLGDKGKLMIQGERAVLTLSGASTTALRDWLTEVRAGARARPVEANLTRGAQGTSGTLVLAIGGTP